MAASRDKEQEVRPMSGKTVEPVRMDAGRNEEQEVRPVDGRTDDIT
jgi:hypothetical protein